MSKKKKNNEVDNGKDVRWRGIEETNLTQEKFDKILCPTLRIGVRMGLLNPDTRGWVRTEELYDYLVYIGVKRHSGILNGLIVTGGVAPRRKKKDHVNITEFDGSFLDHGSSSGILNNPCGFSETRLDMLKSFSKDGKCLYHQDIAAAANDFNKYPAVRKSFLGTNIQSLELGTLLKLLGRKSEQGENHLTMDDVDAIWKDSRFPDGWERPKAMSGTWVGMKKYWSMVFARIFA